MVQAVRRTVDDHRTNKLEGLSVVKRRVGSHEILYAPDAPAHELYVLLSGRVSVARITYEGKRLVTELLGPGDVFGNISLSEEGAGDETAEAVEESVVLALDPTAALSLVESDPKWVLRLLGAATRRLHGTVERLEEFAYHTTEARIAAAILRYASEEDRTARASHQEIAEMAGTYRETATRRLNALQARRVLSLQRLAIRIEDEEELASLAGRPALMTAAS